MPHSQKELVTFLRKHCVDHVEMIDKLKICYRPDICPFDQLLELLPDEVSVFDIGCGNGMFLSLVAHYCKPKALGGVEISEKLIRNAKELLLKISEKKPFLSTYDGKSLPDTLAQYNYIFLIDVFHHVPANDQKKIISEIYLKMKTGATFVLKDIDASKKILVKFNKLHDMILSGETGNEISLAEAQEQLTNTGFKILSSEYKRMLVYPHYTIVCSK